LEWFIVTANATHTAVTSPDYETDRLSSSGLTSKLLQLTAVTVENDSWRGQLEPQS